MYLGGNELTGEMPPSLGELRNLRRLWLAGNDFSGHLPRAVARLPDLTHLDCFGCRRLVVPAELRTRPAPLRQVYASKFEGEVYGDDRDAA